MYKFISIILLCSPMLVLAGQNCSTTSNIDSSKEMLEIKTDVPKYLEGAKIIVRLKDGTESVVPAERFKVVARKQQFIVTLIQQTDSTMCSAEINKNRVNLLAGQGPKGTLSVDKSSSKVQVESQVGVVGGIQYQRLITDRVNLSIQGQTNDSALIGVGLDF